GIDCQDVEQAIELAKAMQENDETTLLVSDYVDANVSVKVVKIIQSYTKIINSVVWGKIN
ncbi:MAG: UDP-N-acetylglucosamine 2-epimerase (non-hydrolyzing), partial [Desulfitobacteriaceae bacterium]